MISPVGEISRRLESPEESYSRGLARTICAFATAFVVAVLISCIIRSLRRYFHESQHHPSTASTSSPPGQRCREFVVSIPVIIYGIGPSPSSSCTDDTMSMCAICLGEFEKGERVSVLPRCNHMFHTDCIKQWVPEKSMNCPTCRVPAAGRDGGPARMTGRVAEMMGVDNRSLSALLALNLSSSGVTISSHAGNVL